MIENGKNVAIYIHNESIFSIVLSYLILMISFELSKVHNITSLFSPYNEVSHLTLLPVLQILLKRNFIRLCGIL